jgi:hypothetical protein
VRVRRLDRANVIDPPRRPRGVGRVARQQTDPPPDRKRPLQPDCNGGRDRRDQEGPRAIRHLAKRPVIPQEGTTGHKVVPVHTRGVGGSIPPAPTTFPTSGQDQEAIRDSSPRVSHANATGDLDHSHSELLQKDWRAWSTRSREDTDPVTRGSVDLFEEMKVHLSGA